MTVLQINFLDVISMMDNILAKAINKILPNDLKLQLKAEIEKHSIKMSEAMLADGTKIEIDGEVAPNSKVYVFSETGKVPAPDATHEVVSADGSITLVTTVNGVITNVGPKATEMSAEEKAKQAEEEKKKAAEAQMQSVTMSKVSDVEVKLSAVEKENESLKAELKRVKESVTVLLSAFDKLANTPVEEKQVKLSKSYEDMTPSERYRYNKGL